MPATTVAVLGSTGSIGTQTLDIVAARPDDFNVVALGAARSADLLVEQAATFRPRVVAVADPDVAVDVATRVPAGIEVLSGPESLAEAAVVANVAVNGIVGFAGLPVTLAVLEAGNRLALANKESLIAAGPVVRRARQTPGAELLPVDSEHCAIHQCMRANDNPERVDRIVLTASGGPFRGRSLSDLESVTVEDALDHPTWSMGPKITVDSSTLMNKGLEVIEAHELFGTGYDQIDVVVHPQSIVHSMVTFTDGATIAQLSLPDMRLCMGYALAYPDRLDLPFGEVDWVDLNRLDFEMPDRRAFPCLDLAYAAGRLGETAPAWLSAANEVAVESFLAGDLAWAAIAEVLAEALNSWPGGVADSVEAVLDADRRSREATSMLVARAR
ncbi:MAG: 1-deoxy-D-xylulose-5-phosphate reductoisomerase [Acidimicrobiales bacterium]|jgi:1-deoxy-D-xylulose-5-phosphate reductoisomerase|nr:1-deoxy-D-xylulose-5-phosphate reductoisomerase [Actinomycetota bacterium]MDP6281392.1 1-deoxy-D-xylulose-5-phosphate reductoisomerase [Acidimicrobiales bacterium]MDP7117226.1 1-deoxy-D-xylulose-5-phosphate reductoisomerase [Acidimicrobiales bacterium]MDP7410823.1 1-deoxy-D-xylulose-5-phosphate reductoisomerase [Acidimicrobiales bacterium]MEE1521968.1 1-deoxy-D-xylulose-5-phosphate reductoisomerase [Acidimicrobiales bacterium]|tara:strand:+ start:6297 stop:7454 length:1158 start_codon:yes stop_codon:yes gene_type:complete